MDPSQLLHAHSGRSGEDLLFDLDEERHGHGALSSMAAEPTTPSAGQVNTNVSLAESRSLKHLFGSPFNDVLEILQHSLLFNAKIDVFAGWQAFAPVAIV